MSLILTLSIDKNAHDHFTALRNAHFPAWCNCLEAHITLFHRLPEEEPLVGDSVARWARRAPFSLEVTGPRNTGHGVAFVLSSPQLMELHREMQLVWSDFLVSKDRTPLWPHITVQNKVTAFKALRTTALLAQTFTPFTIQATGLALWRYAKGYWEPVRDGAFDPV